MTESPRKTLIGKILYYDVNADDIRKAVGDLDYVISKVMNLNQLDNGFCIIIDDDNRITEVIQLSNIVGKTLDEKNLTNTTVHDEYHLLVDPELLKKIFILG